MTREERDKLILELGKRFTLEPFDVKDAALAAMLWHYGKNARDKTASPRNGQRVLLRADTMIVATAKGHGATEFYSEDAGARDMAGCVGMTAKQLPTVAPDFFVEGGLSEAITLPEARNAED